MTLLAPVLPIALAAGVAAGLFAPPPAASRPVVVVELFTSQGCSSCPPADAVLAEIGRDPGVLALAFHVDYWDELGWADPFASPAWSERQRAYGRTIEGGVYTPEAVIDGRVGLVGSRRSSVAREIGAARARPASATVTLRAKLDGDAVEAEVDASAPRGEVMLVLVESGLSTKIARGENGGRTLRAEFVVRSLDDLGRASGKPLTRRIPLPRGVSRDHLSVAAFVQDPSTHEILGAARAASLTPAR